MKHLKIGGYQPAEHTPGLFKHNISNFQPPIHSGCEQLWRKIHNNRRAPTFDATSTKKYTIQIGTGTQYVGYMIDWNYKAKGVTLPMPGVIQKALTRFQYLILKKPATHTTWIQCSSLWKENTVCRSGKRLCQTNKYGTRLCTGNGGYVPILRPMDQWNDATRSRHHHHTHHHCTIHNTKKRKLTVSLTLHTPTQSRQ